MNEFIHGVVRAAAETFDFPEPILEVGSYLVAGQEELANLRGFFPGKPYVGIDMRAGPGVDSVESVERLPRGDATVGSVLALNVFEHVERFWRGFEEVQRVLRPDGLLLVSCPFYFHIHAYPSDYWRFTPEALLSLLGNLPSRIVGYHGPRNRPLEVWVLAAGRAFRPITEVDHARFRELIRRYARQPLRWDKSLHYRLGRLLFGRGPFAPYLEAEQFETALVAA
jgi:SAM-dependent methyltransferase